MSKHVTKFKKKQRKLSKQIQGSKRWKYTVGCIGKISRKIAKKRKNWQHQVSNAIAHCYGKVAVEDLRISNMTKSAKGTIDNPGKKVKQKSGLNREILNTAWSGLLNKLAYKTEVVRVNPRYTSQMCNKCGVIAKDNRKTQSAFICITCGHRDNADVNASKNIKALGMAHLGVEEKVTFPMKRETPVSYQLSLHN